MGFGDYLGDRPAWNQPILFLSLPGCHCLLCLSSFASLRESRLIKSRLQLVAQLLSYPMGRAWAAFLPNVRIFGVRVNPGPFSVKEHVIVTIMAGVGAQSAYAVRLANNTHQPYLTVRMQTDIIAVQRVFYNQTYSFMYQWLVVMSTQLIGFSIGGIGKRFLVSPPSMSTCLLIEICVYLLMLRFSLARESRAVRAV